MKEFITFIIYMYLQDEFERGLIFILANPKWSI